MTLVTGAIDEQDGQEGASLIPVCITNCADCGVGTGTLGEWYMVTDDVWEQAWCGRRKSWHGRVPGQEILCIGCLEARIGRTSRARRPAPFQ
jgi:hypothetical protein